MTIDHGKMLHETIGEQLDAAEGTIEERIATVNANAAKTIADVERGRVALEGFGNAFIAATNLTRNAMEGAATQPTDMERVMRNLERHTAAARAAWPALPTPVRNEVNKKFTASFEDTLEIADKIVGSIKIALSLHAPKGRR